MKYEQFVTQIMRGKLESMTQQLIQLKNIEGSQFQITLFFYLSTPVYNVHMFETTECHSHSIPLDIPVKTFIQES